MLTKTLSEAKKKQRTSLIKAMNNDIGSIDSAKDSWNPAQISERAKDITYIRSLVDSWNPAQLNEALKMLDLPVIDTWNPAQIEEQRRNLVFYLAERTLTGNPITLKILGNLTPEVTGLKVTMNPIQDLSHGDPSPTNICPITGRTEVSVTRTAGEDEETKTHQYSETIYGGSYDFVNGELTNEFGIVDLGTLTYTYYEYASGKGGGYSDSIGIVVKKPSSRDDTVGAIQNKGLVVSDNTFGSRFVDYELSITPFGRIKVYCDGVTSASELKNALSGTYLCYPLDTPTVIETTPEEITLLKGTNVLSTDGDSIELKYKQNF